MRTEQAGFFSVIAPSCRWDWFQTLTQARRWAIQMIDAGTYTATIVEIYVDGEDVFIERI